MSKIITFDEVMKVEMRVGEIMEAEAVEGSSKLIKMKVGFGVEIGERTIFAGISKWYEAKELVGKRTVFIVNMEPKRMGEMGVSEGMVVAAEVNEGGEKKAVLLWPDKQVKPGGRVF